MARIWSAWLPDLLPQLPGCPTVLVEHELKRAAQEFFIRTRAYKVVLAPVAVSALQSDVAITPTDPEIELVRVEHVWYDGKELPAMTAEKLSATYGDDWQSLNGSPVAYLQDTVGTVRLFPIPADASVTGLVCRASVKPSEASTGIPDLLGVIYRDEITSGTKAKLMLYAEKPWTNIDHGAKHEQDFLNAIAKHHTLAATGQGNSRVEGRKTWF